MCCIHNDIPCVGKFLRLNNFAIFVDLLATSKFQCEICIALLLSMIPRLSSSKIYSRKGPFLENFPIHRSVFYSELVMVATGWQYSYYE